MAADFPSPTTTNSAGLQGQAKAGNAQLCTGSCIHCSWIPPFSVCHQLIGHHGDIALCFVAPFLDRCYCSAASFWFVLLWFSVPSEEVSCLGTLVAAGMTWELLLCCPLSPLWPIIQTQLVLQCSPVQVSRWYSSQLQYYAVWGRCWNCSFYVSLSCEVGSAAPQPLCIFVTLASVVV